MSNYFLTLKNKNSVEQLNLKSLPEGAELKKIENLDKFTIQFSDENKLKEHLLKNRILSENDPETELSITYQANGERKEIPILYNDSQKEYLSIVNFAENVAAYNNSRVGFFLKGTPLEKRLNYYEDITYPGSFDALGNFGSTYLKHLIKYCADQFERIKDEEGIKHIISTDIKIIEEHIKRANKEDQKKRFYISLFELYYYILCKQDIEERKIDRNKVEQKISINPDYKRIRDYVVNYCDYKKNILRLREIEREREYLRNVLAKKIGEEYDQKIIDDYEEFIRNREKAKNTQGEQLNLLDISIINDDYEEPIFPPNSEEEREYEERLKIESSGESIRNMEDFSSEPKIQLKK